MIKLSTKGQYGTRFMVNLALHYNKGYVLLKNIARSEDISAGYLEQIIPPLKTAGLILSKRGIQGGYSLAKSPSQITIKDVIKVLEGPLSLVECVDTPSVCEKVNFCVTRDVWKKLGENISQTLESVTLEDMVKISKNKNMSSLIYNI